MTNANEQLRNKFTLSRENEASNGAFIKEILSCNPSFQKEVQRRSPDLFAYYNHLATPGFEKDAYAAGGHLTSQIIANGGALLPSDGNQFIIDAMESASLLSKVDRKVMSRPSDNIAFASMNDRVLFAATEAAVPGGTTRSDTARLPINTVHMRGRVRITRSYLEDNIEQEGFIQTLMHNMGVAIANDMEKDCLNGDKAGGTAPTETNGVATTAFDGWVKRTGKARSTTGDASATVVNAPIAAAGSVYSSAYTRAAINLLQDKYLTPDLSILMHTVDFTNYMQHLADIGLTGYFFLMDSRAAFIDPVHQVPIIKTTHLNRGTVLIADPKNLTVCYWREMEVEMFYDASTEEWIFYPSIRYVPTIKTPEATVLVTGLGTTGVATP